MGWSYHTTPRTRAEFLAELTRAEDFEHNGKRIVRNCLAQHDAGNVLWAVWHVVTSEREYRYIGCDILEGSGRCCWGYKDLSECMGPYYYNCPLEFLDMVPVANEEWRAEVIKQAAALA